jgi:hypothetical protein
MAGHCSPAEHGDAVARMTGRHGHTPGPATLHGFDAMTARFTLVLAPVLALCLATPAMAASALDGAWRLQGGEFVDGAGQRVDYGEAKLEGIKVLQGDTFAFTTTRDGKFWAGGAGSYVADHGHYTEAPRMASFPLEGDGQYHFEYRIEGDTWTLERRDAQGTVVEREVWRRVPAPAGAAHAN